MACLDVIIVGAAIDRKVSCGCDLVCVCVVSEFVGSQDVRAIVNLGIPVQLVSVADLFLTVCADGCGVRILERSLSGAGGVR